MATLGPKYPTRPLGPPRDVSLTKAGAGIKAQEFDEGWVYELYAPIGSAPGVMPRAKTAKLIFEGHWLAAFEADGVNYLTLWVHRKTHDRLFPAGPPSYRYYDDEASRDALTRYSTWVDPNDTNPSVRTGELKLVEIARLEEAHHKIL